jgi:hypothetical protein
LTRPTAMKIPGYIREIWGAPPLLRHEDPKIYEKLARQIAAAIGPIDVIDWLAVKDVLDLTWELLRLRKFKMMLIKLRRAEILQDNRRQAEGADATAQAAQGALENEHENEREAQAWSDELERYYASQPGETVLFLANLDDWVRIDSLIADVEVRRAVVVREIERRRAGLAERLRRTSENIIEGECEEQAKAQTSESEAPPPRVLGPPF